jgi:hypothetical protein
MGKGGKSDSVTIDPYVVQRVEAIQERVVPPCRQRDGMETSGRCGESFPEAQDSEPAP